MELVLKSNQELTWPRSDNRGVVLELLKHAGDPVTNGESIAIVSSGGDHAGNIRLLAYVPAADGKKIRPGMSVYFSPSALRAADYGYIKGIVASVSLFPVSCDSIRAELKNRDFAGTLTQEGPSCGSKSTSSRAIRPGAASSGPAAYILPYLREHLFGIGEEGARR